MAEKAELVLSAKDQTAQAFGALKGRLSDLNKTVEKSSGQLGGLGTALRTGLGPAALALAPAAVVAGLAAIVDSGIQAKARLYDLSLQTGITVEALGALAKVAKFSNTDLEAVASASNKLNKTLATTDEDSKGAATAIKALGLNFEDFKQQAPDEQLRSVAKALDGFKEGAGKGAAAMLLFGKEGAKLLPFFKELAERQDLVGKQTTESAKLAKEYEDNLVTLRSAGEAWRNELVTGILPALVRVSNELVDGRKAYGGYLSALLDIGINVDPFKDLGSSIAETRKELDLYQAQLGKAKDRAANQNPLTALFSDAGKQLDVATGKVDTLSKRLAYLRTQQQRAALAGSDGQVLDKFDRKRSLDIQLPEEKDKTKRARDDFGPLLRQIDEKIALDKAALDGVTQLTEAQKFQAKVFADIDGGYVQLNLQQKLVIDGHLQELLAVEKLARAREADLKWIKETNEESAKAVDAQDKKLEQDQQALKAVMQQREEFGLTKEQLVALNAARSADTASQLRQRAAMLDTVGTAGQLRDLYLQQADAIDKTSQAVQDLAAAEARAAIEAEGLQKKIQAAAALQSDVQGFLGQGLRDAAKGNFRAIGDDFVDMLNRMVSEAAAAQLTKALLGDNFGTTGNVGGAAKGSGVVELIGSLLGTYFGSGQATNNTGTNLPTSGGRAAGGPVGAGRLYRINENGPEVLDVGGKQYLMMGARNGRVEPNKSGQGGGGTTVHLTVQAPPGGSRQTATQWGAEVGRQVRIASSRNG